MTMTKRDLVIKVAKKTDMKQTAVMDVLQWTLDIITEELAAGNNVEFRNFGVFEVVTRKARIGRNPNDPEVKKNPIMIPERSVVKFKPGKEMKEQVLKVVIKPKKNAAKAAKGAKKAAK